MALAPKINITSNTDFEAARYLHALRPYKSTIRPKGQKLSRLEVRQQIRMRAPKQVILPSGQKIDVGGGGAGFYYPGLRSSDPKIRAEAIKRGREALFNSALPAITKLAETQERQKIETIPGYAEGYKQRIKALLSEQQALENMKQETIPGYNKLVQQAKGLGTGGQTFIAPEKVRQQLARPGVGAQVAIQKLIRESPDKARKVLNLKPDQSLPTLGLAENQDVTDPYYTARSVAQIQGSKISNADVNALPPQAAKYIQAEQDQKGSGKEIVKQYGGNILGPYGEKTRQRLIKQAERNGWKNQDWNTLTDERVLELALSSPSGTVEQELRDWALGVGNETRAYATLPIAATVIATEAAKGNLDPIKEMGKQAAKDYLGLMRASATGDVGYLYNYAKKNPISTSLSAVEGVGAAGKILSFAGRTKIAQRALLKGVSATALREGEKAPLRQRIAAIPRTEILEYTPPGMSEALTVGTVRKNIFNQMLVPVKRSLLEYSPGDNPGKIRSILARAAKSYREGRYGVQSRTAVRETGRQLHNAQVAARAATADFERSLLGISDKMRKRIIFELAVAPRVIIDGRAVKTSPGMLADKFEKSLEDGKLLLLNGDEVDITDGETIRNMRAVIKELRALDAIPQEQVLKLLEQPRRGLVRILEKHPIIEKASAVEMTNQALLRKLGVDQDTLDQRLFDMTRWTVEGELKDSPIVGTIRSTVDEKLAILRQEREYLAALLEGYDETPRIPYATGGRRIKGMEGVEPVTPAPGVSKILEERTVFQDIPDPGGELPKGYSLTKPKFGVDGKTADPQTFGFTTRKQFRDIYDPTKKQAFTSPALYNLKTPAGIVAFEAPPYARLDVARAIIERFDLSKKTLGDNISVAQDAVRKGEFDAVIESIDGPSRLAAYSKWATYEEDLKRGSTRAAGFASTAGDIIDSSGSKRNFKQFTVKGVVPGHDLVVFADDEPSARYFAEQIVKEVSEKNPKFSLDDLWQAPSEAKPAQKARKEFFDLVRNASTQSFVDAYMKARTDSSSLTQWIDAFDARVAKAHAEDVGAAETRATVPEPVPTPKPVPTPEPKQTVPYNVPVRNPARLMDTEDWKGLPKKLDPKEVSDALAWSVRNWGRPTKIEVILPDVPFLIVRNSDRKTPLTMEEIAAELYYRGFERQGNAPAYKAKIIKVPAGARTFPELPTARVIRITFKRDGGGVIEKLYYFDPKTKSAYTLYKSPKENVGLIFSKTTGKTDGGQADVLQSGLIPHPEREFVYPGEMSIIRGPEFDPNGFGHKNDGSVAFSGDETTPSMRPVDWQPKDYAQPKTQEPVPAPEPTPTPEPAPAPEPAPVSEPVPSPEPVPTPEPVPAPEPAPVYQGVYHGPAPKPTTPPPPDLPAHDPAALLFPIGEYIPRPATREQIERVIAESKQVYSKGKREGQKKVPPTELSSGGVRGITYWRRSFGDNGRLIALVKHVEIDSVKRADTLLHEVLHGIPMELKMLNSPDIKVLERWLGKTYSEWGDAEHERFVDSAMHYLTTGEAPSPKLAGVFNRVRTYLRQVVNQLDRLRRGYQDRNLPPEVKKVFDDYFNYDGKAWDGDTPKPTKSPVRNALRQAAIDAGALPEEIDPILSLFDARARLWGATTKRNPNLWWEAANGAGIRDAIAVKYNAQLSASGVKQWLKWIDDEIRILNDERKQAVGTVAGKMIEDTQAAMAAGARGPTLFVSTSQSRGGVGARDQGRLAAAGIGNVGTKIIGARGRKRTGKSGAKGIFNLNAREVIRRAQVTPRMYALIQGLSKFIQKNSEAITIRSEQDIQDLLDRNVQLADFQLIDADNAFKANNLNEIKRLNDHLENAVDYPEAEALDILNIPVLQVDAVRERLAEGKAVNLIVVPKTTWTKMQEVLSDAVQSRDPGILTRFSQTWQRVNLTILPRTPVANIVGNTILAAYAGFRPRAFVQAVRMMREGTLPPEIQSRGIYGMLTETSGQNLRLERALKPIRFWMSMMQRGNILSEDLARATLYLDGLMTEANRATGMRVASRMRRMNQDAQELFDAVLNGTANGPKAERLRLTALRRAEDWLGSYRRGGSFERALAVAIPFNQWYRHILRLTFLTMPYDYPGRSAMLQTLAQMGEEYQREHGVWPDWAQDILPLWEEERQTPYGKGRAIIGIRTASLNPFSTATEVANFIKDPINATIQIGSPLAQAVAQAALVVSIKDGGATPAYDPETGKRIERGMNPEYANFVVRQAESLLPLAFLRDPGQSVTSSFINPQARTYKRPRGLEPTRIPNTMWIKLLKAIGVSPTVIDAQGPVERARLDSYAASLRKRRYAGKNK